MSERNWAGNVIYTASSIHRPASVEELAELCASAPRLRVLGSRHSFNTIADAAELVSLRGLPGEVSVGSDRATASCPAGLTYGELARSLALHGLALANLGSLPHISVGGSVSTATHGSGDRAGNLATSVAALELVSSTGELITLRRGERDFEGAVVGLGALGALTRVTLDVEPDYEVSQRVYERLPWSSLERDFDEVFAAGDSVSVFTLWGETAGRLWVKRRERGDAPASPADPEMFGASAAARQLHPIPGGDPAAATAQLGVAGPWFERLPHFRLEFTPSAGDELQSEYLLPRRHAADAIAALRRLGPQIAPLLHIGEIRTVAADSLWLSPQYERDCVAIHFTWRREQAQVERLLRDVEHALAPFAPRPHWGKLFLARAAEIAAAYERLADWAALISRIDPRGAFRNDWLEATVLGGAA